MDLYVGKRSSETVRKIGKLILEKDKVDPGKTTIICTEDEGEGQRLSLIHISFSKPDAADL